jgi:hypothetical protein
MVQIILIALLSLLAQLVLPWWSLALVAFGVCFWRCQGSGRAFLYGFIGIAVVWLGYALIIQLQTDGVFVGRMSELLFKTNTGFLPVLVTTLLGGIVGGVAGIAGYFVRQALVNPSPVRNA